MKHFLQIDEHHIAGRMLHLTYHGYTPGASRPRLVALFITNNTDRRIPLTISCERAEPDGFHFHGQAAIDLGHVFPGSVSSDVVRLSFLLSAGYQTLETDLTLELPGSFFTESVGFCSHTVIRLMKFGLATLCLPCLLAINAVQMLVRQRQLIPRQLLKNTNRLIKDFSGYSYSIREWKTGYYTRCYQKYAKHPVIKNQILLLSERPLEENSNMNCVRTELLKQNHLILKEFICPLPVHRLNRRQLREAARLTAASSIIILEDFYPQIHALSLRPESRLIQLWHACGAFKTFGFSRLGKPGGPAEDSKNHRSYDYAMVSGSSIAPIYSEAFAIPLDHIKPLGVPRTDIFFQKDYQEQIRQDLYSRYPVLKGKKIILFAPTFRGEGNKDAYYPVDRFDVNTFLAQLPEDYFLIIKHHPFVHAQPAIDKTYQHRVLDMSGSVSINHLLFVTDLLITDYSSSVFEAALLSIPMLFYAFDHDEYLKDRDSYFDYDSFVPGEIITKEAALAPAVRKILQRQDQADRNRQLEFLRHYFLDALDGHSTERICAFILELLSSKN